MLCLIKIVTIITVLSTTKVSASFFDAFQGAVLSIQTSFGKLVADVVSDVKDTVDCTMLAVQHVFSLSDDNSDHYYEKCKSGGVYPSTVSSTDMYVSTFSPKMEVSDKEEIINEDIKRTLPEEINAAVNRTLSEILGDYNVKDRLENVEGVLAKDSELLADVSALLKKEFGKLSSEFNNEFIIIEKSDSPPSIKSILDGVKLLQKKEQNDKNSTAAKEIHQVIDTVLDKLEIVGVTETSETVRLKESLKDVEFYSNDTLSNIENQLDERNEEKSTYLDDIKYIKQKEKQIFNNIGSNNISNTLSNESEEIRKNSSVNKGVISNESSVFNNQTPKKLIFNVFGETNYPLNITTESVSTNKLSMNITDIWSDVSTFNSTQKPFLIEPTDSYDVKLRSVLNNSFTSTLNLTTIHPDSAAIIVLPLTNQPTPTVKSNTTIVEDADSTLLAAIEPTTASGIITTLKINSYDSGQVRSTFTSVGAIHLNNTTEFNIQEPTSKNIVLLEELYDTDIKEHRSNKTGKNHIDNPTAIGTSASYQKGLNKNLTQQEPNYDSRSFVNKPLLGMITKSVTYKSRQPKISRYLNEETQVQPSVSFSDLFGNKLNQNVMVDNKTNMDIKSQALLTTVKPNTLTGQVANEPSNVFDYEGFFSRRTKNSSMHKKAVKDAKRLIEDSKRTNLIMNRILEHRKPARSIFEYMHPLNST